MSVESGDSLQPLLGNVEVRADARAVFAQTIHTVNLSSGSSLTSYDLFASVPPLPTNFIARPELSEPLLESLLSETSAVGLAALEGMGGVGKSIAALSVCHDPRVRQAFPDGIVWLTFGRQSGVSLEQRIEKVATDLNQHFPTYNETAYRSLLRGKAALVVLDDVWTLNDAEPFLPPPGRSRLLYTSRNREIAGPLGAESYEIGILGAEQARQFLLHWSGRERELPPEQCIEGILGECKGLVLALAMIGAALRKQDDREWATVLANLRKRFKHIGGRPGGYKHETLHASIAISVDALDFATRQAYLQLAVLLEDMAASEILLQALWGGDSDHVHSLARRLVDRSLASRDAEGSLRLHDLQLGFLCNEYPDSAALALIHATALRSLHVFKPHPEQFSSQMIGRLLPYTATPGIANFLKDLDAHAERPRLRPIRAALQPASGATTRVIEGHSGWVSAVALSANGRRAVSGSQDQTIRVWDLESNAPPRILEDNTGWVRAVALSADGRWVASGPGDKTIRVWDLESNAPPRTLYGHRAGVTAVALSADGRRAVSGSADKTVCVWDLAGNGLPRTLYGHTDGVMAVALSADGRWAVSGSNDGTVRVWDLQDNVPARILEGHSGWVMAVALSADGNTVVSGSNDQTVRVWDLQGNAPSRILEGHKDWVRAVALSADSRKVVSGSGDHTIRVWDLQSNEPPRILEGHSGWVSAVTLSADGRMAVSGSGDKTIRVWDLQGSIPPRILEGHSGWVYAVALSADGITGVSGSSDRTVRVWNLQSNAPSRILKGHGASVYGVALSKDGSRLVSGSGDKTICAWDLQGNTPPRLLEGHSGRVYSVALSADGTRAISGSRDKTIRVWDLQGNTPPRILEGHSGEIYSVALSADGSRAVSGSDDKTIRVWDLQGNMPPRILEGHSGAIYSVGLSADGSKAVSRSFKSMRIWDLGSNAPSRILNKGGVTAVALSPDGRWAVSGSYDKTMHVWDLATWECVSIFTCDARIVSCSWASKNIAVGDAGGQFHLFHWEE